MTLHGEYPDPVQTVTGSLREICDLLFRK